MKEKTLRVDALTKEDLPNQKERRAHVSVNESVVTVSIYSIVVREGFNLRDEEDFENNEDLENIPVIGLQQPLRGDILADGKALLTDGERRFRFIKNVLIPKFKGDEKMLKKLEKVPWIVNDTSMTDADRRASMMVANTGKEFTPMQIAEGFRRMRDIDGKNLSQIATETGHNIPYVEQRLLLADATKQEKESISKGHVDPTAYVALARIEKSPEKRMERIKKATDQGKKLKVKDVKMPPSARLAAEIQTLVIRAQHKTDGEALNLLIEADNRLNELIGNLKK